MKKKIIGILTAAMILSTESTIFAAQIDGDLTYEEGADIYVPTKEEKTLIEEKQAEVEKISSKFGILSSQGVYKELNVPHYKQENEYYCGPATVKQTLQYINNSSLSQTEYANKLGTTPAGTDMTKIAPLINTYVPSSKAYSYQSIGSFSHYLSSIYAALCQNKPIIIDMKAQDGDGWSYTTDGHFLNISGINSNATINKLKVTDPNSTDSYNWYDSSIVYNVNNKHTRQAFIW